MNWEIGNYRYFSLLLLMVVVMVLFWRFLRWRKEKRKAFAEEKFHERIIGKDSNFSKMMILWYGLAFFLLVFSFVDVVRNENEEVEIDQKTSSVMFLVDVSNSMNAQDIEPSRLEQSRLILERILQRLSHEKVGIVLFAGEARSMMPLTMDYSSASIYLENLSSSLISVQGTDFLLGMEETIKKMNKVSGNKSVILISDGEDNEGNHDKAISLAQQNNIVVTAVGVGTEEGGIIPELQFGFYEDFKKDENGEVVITKRETNALKSIAEKTGGRYIDGNDVETAVGAVLESIQRTDKQQDTTKMNLKSTAHYYQWFLGGVLLFLFLIYFFNPKKDLNI